jgi:hypothetical protein
MKKEDQDQDDYADDLRKKNRENVWKICFKSRRRTADNSFMLQMGIIRILPPPGPTAVRVVVVRVVTVVAIWLLFVY